VGKRDRRGEVPGQGVARALPAASLAGNDGVTAAQAAIERTNSGGARGGNAQSVLRFVGQATSGALAFAPGGVQPIGVQVAVRVGDLGGTKDGFCDF